MPNDNNKQCGAAHCSAPGVIRERPLRPGAPVLGHLLSNLLWSFLALVLITFLTLLIRSLLTPRNLRRKGN